MTNFFEHQEAARRRTAWLVFLYVVALLCTVTISVGATIAVLWYFVTPTRGANLSGFDTPGLSATAVGEIALAVGVLQTLVILGASWTKMAQLSSGGKAVALMLGGQELLTQSARSNERRLLNIVEEMALASGVPVPAVYVMEDEKGINAFAAGHAPGDAVIGVSRGCIEYLTRDELQGVIAHEFSHILNGDMSLNLKLIGWVFGLIALSTVGYMMIRVLSDSRSSNRSSNDKDSKGDGLLIALFLIGVLIWILGLVGAWFGDLIKASISRQREYLADASAVQFTRNPDGIAGALKKIGGLQRGSQVGSPNAAEVSHLFFASAFTREMFATHPPLEDRIRRLDNQWDGVYPDVQAVTVGEDKPVRSAGTRARVPINIPGMPIPVVAGPAALALTVDRIATPTPERADHASDLIDRFSDPLIEAASDPFAARMLIYCLTLGRDEPLRSRQRLLLDKMLTPAESEACAQLLPEVDRLAETGRLPLLDLTIPALRRMSPTQYGDFRSHLDAVIQSDAQLSVFEYLLYCVMERHLDPAFGRPPRQASGPIGNLLASVAEVVSLVAYVGSTSDEAALSAYAEGMALYASGQTVPPLADRASCTIEGLDGRLRRLARLAPRERKRILLACAASIAADGKATVREIELCRAIGDSLGCPVPPLPPPANA